MKKLLITFLVCLLNLAASSQRLSSALNMHTPVIGIIRYGQNYYNPENLNRIYFVSAPGEKIKKGSVSLINPKWHSRLGFGLGYTLKLDYKRFALRTGVQLTYEFIAIKLNQFGNDGEADKHKEIFSINTFSTSVPLLASLDLKRKNNSPFVIFGADYGYYTLATERIDDINFDRDYLSYMFGIFYNEKAWVNLNIGYGKKWKLLEIYAVYKHRIDEGKKSLTIKSAHIDFNLNFYFGYNSIKRKHYLYREDE